jgi:hypothetical protein
MLWVGNSLFSYNNGMHGHVSRLVRGGDKSVSHRGVSVTISGSGIDQRRPDIELYVPDKRHPSLAGTYLAAATVYGALLGKSPVGNTYTAGLPKDVAAHLQQAAWGTVQEFSRK